MRGGWELRHFQAGEGLRHFGGGMHERGNEGLHGSSDVIGDNGLRVLCRDGLHFRVYGTQHFGGRVFQSRDENIGKLFLEGEADGLTKSVGEGASEIWNIDGVTRDLFDAFVDAVRDN